MSLFTLILYLLIIPIVIYYLFSRYSFGYWKRWGVYSIKPSFPGGNLGKVITGKLQLGVRIQELYEKSKHRPFVGLYLFQSKALLINDLDLIKDVLVKDFHTFPSHGLGYSPDNDPLSKHLFNMDGSEWKELRAKLTPTFTSNKMKYMFDTLLKCSEEMELFLEKEVEVGKDVDIRETLAKYGTDVIGSCAFGIETNSFKYPDAEFRKMGKKIFSATFVQMAKEIMTLYAPSLIKRLKIRLVYEDVEKFFIKTIEDTILYREQNNITKNDFLQLLIDMKKMDNDNGLTLIEIVAQVYLFFIAGFETSSTAASFAFYELAKNPDVQAKLRQEIDDVTFKNGGSITYDSILEMKYLTQVIEETLRMYPPLPFLFRTSVADYQIPNTYTTIEKGTLIIIPILAIQRDQNIHDEPLEFKPERFSSEAKHSMKQFSSMPFGEGPRMCIGNRFGMMQTRLGLVSILKKFEISVCEDTLIPMKFSPNSPILMPKGKHLLRLTRRKC